MSRGFRNVRTRNTVRGLGLKTCQEAMCREQRKRAVIKRDYMHEKEKECLGDSVYYVLERDEKDGMKRNVNKLCAGNRGDMLW